MDDFMTPIERLHTHTPDITTEAAERILFDKRIERLPLIGTAALGIEPRATGALLPRPEGRGLPRSQINEPEAPAADDVCENLYAMPR